MVEKHWRNVEDIGIAYDRDTGTIIIYIDGQCRLRASACQMPAEWVETDNMAVPRAVTTYKPGLRIEQYFEDEC